MKFLLIVLALQLIGELIGYKRKNKTGTAPEAGNETVIHPAEYNIR